jgi:phosphoribosylanthranilate isomerase
LDLPLFFEFQEIEYKLSASIKICGITRKEDALEAERLGVFAVGFVFYPASRRFIDPYQAGYISRSLGQSIEKVGVFVNEEPEVIMGTVRKANLTMVQLHGSESPSSLKDLEGIRIIKAFRIGENFDTGILSEYMADYFLLDSSSKGSYGGTGKSFDWNIAFHCLKYGKIIVAGGLHAENVENALKIANPWGVDVSTGVEEVPGLKDHQKMGDFVRSVNQYK